MISNVTPNMPIIKTKYQLKITYARRLNSDFLIFLQILRCSSCYDYGEIVNVRSIDMREKKKIFV